jgi:hypothetical protein
MRYKFQKETFRMQHSNPIGQHSSATLTLLDLLEKLHANDNVCDGIECGALLSIPKFRGIGKMLGRCDSRSLGIYALNLIQIFGNFLGSKLVRYSAVLPMSSFPWRSAQALLHAPRRRTFGTVSHLSGRLRSLASSQAFTPAHHYWSSHDDVCLFLSWRASQRRRRRAMHKRQLRMQWNCNM